MLTLFGELNQQWEWTLCWYFIIRAELLYLLQNGETNKWSALALFVNFEWLLIWSAATQTKQTAAVVSPSNRSHVRSPEAADVMSGAFLSYWQRQYVSWGADVKAHSPQIIPRVQLGSQWLTSTVTLSFIGQSWSHIPSPRSKERGVSHMPCKVNEKWVMFLTCRLTINQKLDASCVVKLKGEVGGACKQR